MGCLCCCDKSKSPEDGVRTKKSSTVEPESKNNDSNGNNDGGLTLPLTVGKEELIKQKFVGDPLTDDIMEHEYKEGKKIVDKHSMMVLLYLKNNEKLVNNKEANVKFSPRILNYYNNEILYPAWFDINRIKRGQEFAKLNYSTIGIGLLCYSLPFCYSMDESKTLVLSERLTKHVNSRVLQTIEFVTVIFNDSFGPNGKAIRSCQTIRLIHSGARIAHKKEIKKTFNNQLPVNHLDQFFTLYGCFCLFTLNAIKKLGFNYSDENLQDYVYLWTVIGYFLGMNNKVLLNMEQINDINTLTQFKNDFLDFIINESGQYNIDNNTKELSNALIEWERNTLMASIGITNENGKDLIYTFWRYFLGDDYCDQIELPPSPQADNSTIETLIVLGVVESGFESFDGVPNLIAQLSQHLIKGWLESVTHAKKIPYYLANPPKDTS